MYGKMQEFLQNELAAIREAGLYKEERVIVSPQQAEIKLNSGKEVINFCANNYLGLSNHPKLRFVLSAELPTFTKHSNKKLLSFLEPKIPSFTLLLLMPMVAFLNRCSTNRMPLFRIRSTTLRLLTA